MQRYKSPSDKERRFLDAYIQNGGNGARAAIAAGYGAGSARNQAYKILGRRRVQDELARRAPQMGATRTARLSDQPVFRRVIRVSARNSAGSKSPPPIDGELLPPGSGDGGWPDDPGKLSRDWIIARLMRTALTCLGELPSLQTKVIARADHKGLVTATAIQVEGYNFDAAGANAALAQLSKEMDRRDGIGPVAAAGDVALLPGRADFEKRMAEFTATVKKRQAEAAARAARFNGSRGPETSRD